jgi:hypothetical protein
LSGHRQNAPGTGSNRWLGSFRAKFAIRKALFVTRWSYKSMDFCRAFRQAPEHLSNLAMRIVTVVLPAGGLDLARDLPREETILLAPVAQLVVREDLHPALVGLLLRAAQQVHKPRQLFAPGGTFPTTNYNDFELHEDAARLIERGPSFAVRFLPFWAAVLAERLLVLLIPLLTLLIPLARIAPPAYRWQVRSKIFSKYKQLRRIERDLRANPSSDAKARLQAELAALQQAAEALRVPTSYADTLYNLRLHIRFVREIVAPQ